MSAQLAVDLTGHLPRLEGTAEWERARWPLVGESDVESPSGSLKVEGQLDALEVELLAGFYVRDVLRDVSARVTGSVQIGESFGVDTLFEWHGSLEPESVVVRGQGSLSGELNRVIYLNHRLSVPFAVETDARLKLSGASPVVMIETSLERSALAPRWPSDGAQPLGAIECQRLGERNAGQCGGHSHARSRADQMAISRYRGRFKRCRGQARLPGRHKVAGEDGG